MYMPWDKCLTHSNRRIAHTGRFSVACTIVQALIQHVIAKFCLAWPNYAWRENIYYWEGFLYLKSFLTVFLQQTWLWYEYMGLQEFRLFQILRVPLDLASEIIGRFEGPVVIYSSSNLASLATVEWVWSGSSIFPPKPGSRFWITSHLRISCACGSWAC